MKINRKAAYIGQSLVSAIQKFRCPKTVLKLEQEELGIFENVDDCTLVTNRLPEQELLFKIGSFDLILGEFPIGMAASNPELKNIQLKSHGAAMTVVSTNVLDKNGLGLYVLESAAVLKEQGKKFRSKLEAGGFNITAILNTPVNFLSPYTSLRPLFVIIEKRKIEKIFIAELDDTGQVDNLINNFILGIDSTNLYDGLFIDEIEFNGFGHFKTAEQIRKLETEYKNYKTYKISDIALEVKIGKSGQSLFQSPNAIYVPNVGTQPVVSNLSSSTLKHQNLIEIVCNPEIVNSKYLSSFFGSKLGQLIINSIYSDSLIPTISAVRLLETEIAIPDLVTQSQIINSLKKLNLIRTKVASFEENLAINPISSKEVLSQIDSVLEVVGQLADSDKIKSIVKSGESKTVEFKETLDLDVRTQQKGKHIQDSAIKTIAAFLNTAGGCLLVGVSDKGEMAGVEYEVSKFHKDKEGNPSKSRDNFLLHFKNLIKSRIGEGFYPLIDHKLIEVDSRYVLIVEVKKSSEAVYVDGKDFYVRTNPATDKLEGPQLVAYIKNHFH